MRSFLFTIVLSTGIAASAQVQSIQPQQRPFPTPQVQAPAMVPPPPAATAASPASDSACPANLSASRRATPTTLWTLSHQDNSAASFPHRVIGSSGVHVQLSPSQYVQMPRSILRAELSVDYYAPGARIIPVDGRPEPPTLSKTFSIHAGDIPSWSLDADLLVGETAGIVRVHLLSLTFADGTWWGSNATACSTVPSLFVPVSN